MQRHGCTLPRVDIEEAFEQPCPTHSRRRVRVLGCLPGGIVCWTQHARSPQLIFILFYQVRNTTLGSAAGLAPGFVHAESTSLGTVLNAHKTRVVGILVASSSARTRSAPRLRWFCRHSSAANRSGPPSPTSCPPAPGHLRIATSARPTGMRRRPGLAANRLAPRRWPRRRGSSTAARCAHS